jgi:hypothetical protein
LQQFKTNDFGLFVIDTMVKRRKLNVVRKSGKSQAKTQLIDSSNEVNRSRNEECAQFGVGKKFLLAQFLSSFLCLGSS